MGSCGSVKYAKEEKKTIQMIDHFQNNALSGFTAVMAYAKETYSQQILERRSVFQ